MDTAGVTREILWNVPFWARALMYMLLFAAGTVFACGIGRRIRLWQGGQPSPAEGTRGQRIARFLWHGGAQIRIWRSSLAGASHMMLWWAFVVLTIVTTIVALADYGFTRFFHGRCYLVVSLVADLFGAVLIAGCVVAMLRRRLDRRFTPLARPIDRAILWIILAIAITGFLIEGLRIAGTGRTAHGFEVVALVGWILAGWFEPLSPVAIRGWHLGLWLLHMGLTMALVAAMPYTKLRHALFAPLGLLAAQPQRPGRYQPVAIEQVEETGRYGADRPMDFSWRELLSFDSCTHCGRCQSVCPAHATDKPLDPMKLVVDLAAAMGSAKTLHGATVAADTLWACTSCAACVVECPVLIDQLGAIVQLRRGLVGQGEIRGGQQAALRSIDNSGNPWGLPADQRSAWTEGLDVPTIEGQPHPQLLFWVGCAGSYDRRNQKVSRALVKILTAADIHFAILGDRERCTGDPARRMGDEFTFAAAAERNIETLNQVDPQRIVTACPHCFNTLKHEYPNYGGNYEVIHHTQLIQELVDAGRLRLQAKPAAVPTVLHDACYLGRHNNLYDGPRKALHHAGVPLAEIPRSRANTFCCGGGGGRMWMEEKIGARINNTRWQQLRLASPQQVAVNCPFCLTMLGDAAAAEDSPIQVRDVAEIVAARLTDDT